MNKLILCIFVSTLLFSFSYADSLDYYHPLKHSFQLRINNLINVSSLQGMICYKRNFNSKDAVRIGVSLTGSTSADLDTIKSDQSSNSAQSDAVSIGIYATYLNYCYNRNNFYLYYGFGPLLSEQFQYNTNNQKYNPYDSLPDRTNSNRSNSFGIGVNGILGIEWIFSKHFSLFTEYNMNVNYYYNKLITIQSGSERRTHTWSISDNNAILGLSIYL